MSLNIVCLLALAALVGAQKPSMADYKAGKAAEAKAASEEKARNAKMGAVNKVIALFTTLEQGVKEEGESEAKSYKEFCNFCDTMKKRKSAAIKTEQDNIVAEKAAIKGLQVDENILTTKEIPGDEASIKKLTKAKAASTATHKAAAKVFARNAADLSSGLHGVTEAIKVLKAGKTASLLQLQDVSSTVDTALMLADAMGLTSGDKAKQSQAFLQSVGTPEVEMENFKFHSSGIIETLETLQGQFRDQKNTLDTEEAKRVAQYNLAQDHASNLIKAGQKALGIDTETNNVKAAQEATETGILHNEEGNLADDQQFLKELNAGCASKKATYEQRTALRMKELTAITYAKNIITTTVSQKTGAATVRLAQVGSNLHIADAVANDEQSMEALEAEAESNEEPTSFFQKLKLRGSSVKAHSPDTKQAVASLLKQRGLELRSAALLDLVGKMSADPLAKVKKLIQELVERLLSEASAEANQKGFCDKAQGDANQKLDYASEKVNDLTAELGKLNAELERLTQELASLGKEKKELEDAVAEATKLRGEEKTQNANTVKEAEEGNKAVKEAIQIIDRFYKTAAKEKVALSEEKNEEEEEEASFLQASPFANAPDAGFDNNEAYKGASDQSGGILGMMDVISSDFARTVRVTKQNEAQAVEDHRNYLIESQSSIAEKNVALATNKRFKDETEGKITDAESSLTTQQALVKTATKELEQLKPACQPKGQSQAERKANAQDEIDSLKAALKLLGED